MSSTYTYLPDQEIQHCHHLRIPNLVFLFLNSINRIINCVFSCVRIFSYFSCGLFKYFMVFRSMNVLQFLYHSTDDRHLSCVKCGTLPNNTAMNITILFFWRPRAVLFCYLFTRKWSCQIKYQVPS